MKEEYKELYNQIAGDLKVSLSSSYFQLMELSKELNPKSELINEIVLLGSEINEEVNDNSTETELKDHYINQSIDLLERIFQELDPHKIDELNGKRQLLIDKFIEKNRIREDVVIAERLCKEFKRSAFKLNNVNLNAKTGEIIGVVGENGNGKSTLLKMIAGEIKPDGGKIQYPIFGFNESSRNWHSLKQQVAYIPQKLRDWGSLDSVKEHLHFNASIKGIHGKDNKRVVNYFIQRLGLQKHQYLHWQELSGGYQLRFELAKAFLWRPRLVILDEPLANLDVKAQKNLLMDLRKIVDSFKYPTSVLISSQNLHEVENTSDKIIFLREGKEIYNGITSNIGIKNNFRCYQLETEFNHRSVISKLNHSGILKIENEDHYLMIYTKKNMGRKELLKLMMEKEIPIKLFRDISNSSRILFEHNEKLNEVA